MLTGMSTTDDPEGIKALMDTARRCYDEALATRAVFVREMRAGGHTQRQLADALGVTPAVIAKIDRQNERNDNG